MVLLRTADLTEATPGVFYTREPVVAVDRRVVEFLRQTAARSPLKRARLCAHPSPDAAQHDMLIVSRRDTYVAPHRHLTKSETLLVIEGEADAVLFDDAGNVADVLRMGPAGSGRLFFYRMPQLTYHGLLVDSDDLVFVESTKGPFRPSDSENARWAPPPDDAEAGARFAGELRHRCAAWR